MGGRSAAVVASRIVQTRERIAGAARHAGRDPDDILLVAVTKSHPAEMIAEAYEQGLRHFGENRVEERAEKLPAVESMLSGPATWHMVGHIQSRKTREVVALFDWVHSVDRLKIASRLSQHIAEIAPHKAPLPLLLEVNLSGEASKYGYDLAGWPDAPASIEALFHDVEAMLSLSGIHLEGLMTMAPYVDDPEAVRPVFARLRRLRDMLADRFPSLGWPHLSMGMSNDFEVAIEEGATIVRLGTVLFGPREDAR
jgi:pyridoxal phosphate enzyme (YggS family)